MPDYIVWYTVEEGGFGYKFPYDVSLEEVFSEMTHHGVVKEIDDPNDIENMSMSAGMAILTPFREGLIHAIKVLFNTGYELSIYSAPNGFKSYYQKVVGDWRLEHPPMRKELDPVEVLNWVK